MTDETLYPIKIPCPYCTCHWTVHFERFPHKPELVECETDEGGCGATFAVTAYVEVKVVPTVRKIEGLGPDIPRIEREEKRVTTIHNEHGREMQFNAAGVLMDDAISAELLHGDSMTPQEFFDAYCEKHRQKHGEEFEPNKENPVW